jgi:hypothetical protein
MFETVFLTDSRRTLEAEIIGGECSDWRAVAGRGCLGYDGGAVEDAAQDHFVMRDAAVHGLLTTIEKHFEMFCSEVNTVTGLGDAGVVLFIPQPYMGVPGTGDLILTFLGDAGVVGRPDMMKDVMQVQEDSDS